MMSRYKLDEIFKKYLGKKIAIIGNSDNIYNNEYGTFIDEHDCVIRFNSCYISDENKKYIGKKTNIIILGANLEELYDCYSELYDENHPSLQMREIKKKGNLTKDDKTRILSYYTEKFPQCDYILSNYHVRTSNDVQILEKLINKQVYIYNVNFNRPEYLKYNLKKTPTAGLVIILNLLDLIRQNNIDTEINIFGFNKIEDQEIIYEYYKPKYNKMGNVTKVKDITKPHNMLLERYIIKDLIKEKIINHY